MESPHSIAPRVSSFVLWLYPFVSSTCLQPEGLQTKQCHDQTWDVFTWVRCRIVLVCFIINVLRFAVNVLSGVSLMFYLKRAAWYPRGFEMRNFS